MKHIIFDLGNVLVRLDTPACIEAFKKIGMEMVINRANNDAKSVLEQLGLGLISVETFYQKARELSGSHASD